MPVNRIELGCALKAAADEHPATDVGSKVFSAMGAALDYLVAHIDGLEARLKEVESHPFTYEGPHEMGKTYNRGSFVSHAGSLWACNCKTNSRPGDGPAWTLAVKRGADAKGTR
ncbi:MAG: hypothetical protein AB7I35_12885 [Ramlibacter sp.]